MSSNYQEPAPLTIDAALQRLRERTVNNSDHATVDLVDRALAGNYRARSQCIRAWYASKQSNTL